MNKQAFMHSPVQSDCLLWSLRIDDKGQCHTFEPQDSSALQSEEGFTWIHMLADTTDAWDKMKHIGLSDELCDSLLAAETRPRALSAEGGVLIFLRGINYNPDADPEDMVSLRVWFNQHTVVSARRKGRRLLSVQDVKSSLDTGQGPNSSAQLVIELIDKIALRISETLDDLDEPLTDYETEGGVESSARVRLSQIRRKAAAVRRYLAPQRDALDALYRMNNFFDQQQAYQLRDISDRMTRYVEDLDLAKERAMVLQDELRNRIAEQQGMRMYVLSLVTAIFLPLSFLTGVFGMNVAGLPGTENPEAFNLLASAMVIVALVMFVAMLWKKWL